MSYTLWCFATLENCCFCCDDPLTVTVIFVHQKNDSKSVKCRKSFDFNRRQNKKDTSPKERRRRNIVCLIFIAAPIDLSGSISLVFNRISIPIILWRVLSVFVPRSQSYIHYIDIYYLLQTMLQQKINAFLRPVHNTYPVSKGKFLEIVFCCFLLLLLLLLLGERGGVNRPISINSCFKRMSIACLLEHCIDRLWQAVISRHYWAFTW